MDILKPEQLWIGNRCYRINPVANDDIEVNVAPKTNEYVEHDLHGVDAEGDAEAYNVVEIGPKRYKTTFHVAAVFYGVIIGKKAATKKRIEGETKTQITIPKQGANGDIEITGTIRDDVCSARHRIEVIVLASRSKQPITHFTCVPITNQVIRDNFEKFMNDILQGPPIFGLDKSMFIKPNKLHMTIGVMRLMDEIDRTRATQLLYDCLENIVRPIKQQQGKIEMKIRGVDYMNDDPSEVNVLYGKVESDTLQKIADEISEYFIFQGVADRERGRHSVKLHVTLIKSRNMDKNDDDDDQGSTHNRQRRRTVFDARQILQNFADYNFGGQEVNEIHLSCRHTTACDGSYEATASIKF